MAGIYRVLQQSKPLCPPGSARRIRLVLLAIICLMGGSLLARGQAQNTGTISGSIIDASGAVVPKSSLTLVSIATGQVSHSTSNARGEYLFNDIRIGQYRLTAKAAGFGTTTVDNIAVDADQNLKIDLHLNVAGDSADVVVNAEGVTLDTRSATVGALIDQNLIEGLPLDGNNIVSMTALLPGVVDVNAPTTFTSDTAGPTYNASGSRSNQNLMLLDGTMWNNVFYNTGLNYPPSQALQEVSVLLSNYKAQYGRNAGSVFNVLTRSGTNNFHGQVWEYFQNRVLDAADYLSHQNPKLVQNQFGATLGGPVLRNKLFFFGSYQNLRVAQQVTAQDILLTPLERGLDENGGAHPCNAAGSFAGHTCATFKEDAEATYYSAYLACLQGTNPSSCVDKRRTDPNFSSFLSNPMYTQGVLASNAFSTAYRVAGNTGTSPCISLLQSAFSAHGQYLPYSEVPSECFNPVAVQVENKYVPTSVPYDHSTALPYTTTTAPQPRNDQDFFIRGDFTHRTHSIDMRFYGQRANDITSNSVNNGQGIANYELDRNTASLNFGSIGDTWVLRNNILNVLRVGYKRFIYDISPTDPTTLQSLGGDLHLPGTPALPIFVVYNRFTIGSGNSDHSHVVNQTLEVDENLSWTHGNHNLQFGSTWLHLQYDSASEFPGYYYFAPTYFGLSAADFLGGVLYSESFQNTTNLDAVSPNLYLYAQDDWRATPKLTVNYGLRYEIPYVWHQPHGQSATFIPGYQSSVFPTAPANFAFIGDRGIGSTLIPTPYTNLAPRVGFAYDAFGNGKTIIRSGFGIFFDAINASVVGVSTPFHYAATYSLPQGGLSQPLQDLNAVPENYDPHATPQFVKPYSIYFPDPNFKTPYTEAANLGFLQKVGSHGFFEADYILKLGRHQLIPVDLNPAIYDCTGSLYQSNPSLYCPSSFGVGETDASYSARVRYPGFNYGGQGVVDLLTEATSNYNGLQVVGGMRGSKLLSFQASYTYSKSLDEQSNGLTTSAQLAKVYPEPDLRYNYGLSDFDTRHVFNLGWVLKTPSLRGQNRFVRAGLEGWQFSGIYNARSGHPFNVRVAGDSALTKESGQRAALVPGANPYLPSNRHRIDKVNQYFNTAAFTSPDKGQLSNVPRNFMIGPGYISTNMAVGRSFTLPRKMSLQFRADAFNVFNTPNLSNPNGSYSTSAGAQYGRVLSTVGTNGAVQTNGRRMQLSLVLQY